MDRNKLTLFPLLLLLVFSFYLAESRVGIRDQSHSLRSLVRAEARLTEEMSKGESKGAKNSFCHLEFLPQIPTGDLVQLI